MRIRSSSVLGWLVPVVFVATFVASAYAQQSARQAAPASGRASSPLVEKVRVATSQYRDINVALREGWVPATPCVSGPNSGAMGVHFVLPSRIGDGMLKASEPEALIYEPMGNGAMRLVGVEFIVMVGDWEKQHAEGGTPSVDGHLTNRVEAPNRYGLPAFYELHVWAWEQNPNGNFADWNSRVSCDNQPLPVQSAAR